MSLYPTLFAKFSGLQAELGETPRFLYPVDSAPFVRIEKRLRDCVVGIPAVKEDTGLHFGNIVLKNDEFGRYAAGRLVMASTCLLGAKALFLSIFQKPVGTWMAMQHDSQRAQYVVNVVADAVARQKIVETEGKAFYNSVIAPADMICASMLVKRPASLPELAQVSLAGAVLGFPSSYVPSPVLKIVEDFMTELRTVLRGARCREALLGDLYEFVMKIPGPWHRVYLPYANVLPRARAETCIFAQSPNREAFESIRKQTGLGALNYEDALGQDLFFEISRETKRREKVLSRLARSATRSNLGTFGFPPSDLGCYRQLYEEMAPQIRRMVEQARMVRNVLDESMFEQAGNVDLQVAIQAISSQSFRDDMFVRDEDILKNESWAVLVDASLSLGGITKELKSVALCVAEIAKEIIGANPWGIFAFSDEFYCIKDFSEPYDSLARSRIGGLLPGGLSHIPDAIRACRQMLLEHAKERNYIILVSDGLPSGYPDIEKELASSIKEASASGVAVAGIGIGSNKIKKYIPNAKTVGEPSDLARAFSEIYFSLSS